jgi:hypothetical protein
VDDDDVAGFVEQQLTAIKAVNEKSRDLTFLATFSTAGKASTR